MKRHLCRADRSLLLVARVSFLLLALCALFPAMAEADSAMGAVGGLEIEIAEVDSGAFPQVTFSFTVSDPDGWPVTDLLSQNVRVSEDGYDVSDVTVTTSRWAGLTTDLVLALDVSTSEQAFAQMMTAASGLVDALGGDDQLALLTFYEDVQVVQGLTGDRATLRDELEGVALGGSRTALTEAILKAASMLSESSADERAIVVVSDSVDNVDTVSNYEAFQAALDVRVPVYVLTLEPRTSSEPFADFVRLTGGRVLVVSQPDDLSQAVDAVEWLVWESYRVTFTSRLEADGESHELVLKVANEERAVQAKARFTALPGDVDLQVSGVADGQRVAGSVPLRVEASAPGAIAAVEYVLDDSLLARQEVAPFDFDWDAGSASLGPHTLTIRAVDAVGNEGQVSRNVEVVAPIVMSLSATTSTVTAGRPVTVTADVNAVGDVRRVEFLLDGEPVEVTDDPPYQMVLNSERYAAGGHTVLARAVDVDGNRVEDHVDLTVVQPPSEGIDWRARLANWLPYILFVLGALAVLGVLIVDGLILMALLRHQRTRYQQTRRIRIENLGNVPSRYQLRMREPAGSLRFQLVREGKPLQASQSAASETPAPADVQQRQEGGQPAPPQPEAQQRRPGAQVKGAVDKANQSTRKAGGLMGAVAGVAGTIGSILPGSMGASLKRWGGQMRQRQAAVSRVSQAPQRATRRVDAVRRQTGRGKAAVAADAQSSPSTSSSPPGMSGASSSTAAVPDRAPSAASAAGEPHAPPEGWSGTPTVEPGESLALDLRVNPVGRPKESGQRPFAGLARSTNGSAAQGAPLVEEGAIALQRVSWLRHVLPFMLFGLLIVVEIGLLVMLFITLGTLI